MFCATAQPRRAAIELVLTLITNDWLVTPLHAHNPFVCAHHHHHLVFRTVGRWHDYGRQRQTVRTILQALPSHEYIEVSTVLL